MIQCKSNNMKKVLKSITYIGIIILLCVIVKVVYGKLPAFTSYLNEIHVVSFNQIQIIYINKVLIFFIISFCILIAVIITASIWYKRYKIRQQTILSNQIQRFEELEKQHIRENKERAREVTLFCDSIRQSSAWETIIFWKDYDKMCSYINLHCFLLIDKLRNRYCLNKKEIQLCILILVGDFGSNQLADLLFYAKSGIRNLKSKTAKKLGTNSKGLRERLISIAAE